MYIALHLTVRYDLLVLGSSPQIVLIFINHKVKLIYISKSIRN